MGARLASRVGTVTVMEAQQPSDEENGLRWEGTEGTRMEAGDKGNPIEEGTTAAEETTAHGEERGKGRYRGKADFAGLVWVARHAK